MTGPTPRCEALVGSFGSPGMRDLDFGRQVIDCLQQLDWPDGVVVEDLSCSPSLVLHRLQELRPAKVVLLGAVGRGVDAPGGVRRYRLGEAGKVDLEHSVAYARRWGQLPSDTVVIEVEPADTDVGPGFSEALVASFDPILDMVRQELAGVRCQVAAPVAAAAAPAAPDVWADDGGAMADIVSYARDHARARRSRSSPAPVDGVTMAGRVKPWGVFTPSGGDWFDAFPLDAGRLAIVVGDVPGRGVEVTPAMSEVRAAVRAYAVLDGDSPAGVVGRLDRLAGATGEGLGTRLLYLVLDRAARELRFANAGGCPPLLLERAAEGQFLDAAMSGPVGEPAGAGRPEATLQLGMASTLLLYTGGLVESRRVPRALGMEQLRRAAADGPFDLEALCDRILQACTDDLRRDDDICLLAVRP